MRILTTLALAGALFAPVALHAQRERFSPDDVDFIAKAWPAAKKTNTGIRYIIEKEGKGAPAKPGDKVSVLYTGKLLNGKTFDEDQDPAHPFAFRVDRGFVIQGWDQVLQLMKAGEKRLVIIPPDFAYGSRGQVPTVPPDATLVFQIEILKIERVDE
jgi:FKBP-type peptidyl-prolyl cis-trans isomerase